jgi:hypothetical protein
MFVINDDDAMRAFGAATCDDGRRGTKRNYSMSLALKTAFRRTTLRWRTKVFVKGARSRTTRS